MGVPPLMLFYQETKLAVMDIKTLIILIFAKKTHFMLEEKTQNLGSVGAQVFK